MYTEILLMLNPFRSPCPGGNIAKTALPKLTVELTAENQLDKMFQVRRVVLIIPNICTVCSRKDDPMALLH